MRSSFPPLRRREKAYDDDDADASPARRVALGCLIALLAIGFGAALIGIGVGAMSRARSFGAGEGDADPAEVGRGQDAGGPGAGAGDAPPPPPDRRAVEAEEARQRMRQRYRPGPFVSVASMVPNGNLLPAPSLTGSAQGRVVDNPWLVVGADLRASPRPRPTGVGAPSIAHGAGERTGRPLTVLARTPARVEFSARDAAGGTDVQSYLIEFAGYEGHFELPATVQTELGMVQAGGSDGAIIHFTIQAPLRPDGRPLSPGISFPVTMRVAAVDSAGRVSAPVERELQVVSVGAGDVEVTLTMGEPTDLDLYVTDPAGVRIYFGNTSSFSGGRLDLDANAACSGNLGVDNEHVFWPQHRAPAGTYRVHVAHYENCLRGRPVDYRVTVSACGELVVLTGRFDGRARAETCTTPGPGDRAWCQEVVRFDIPPCALGT